MCVRVCACGLVKVRTTRGQSVLPSAVSVPGIELGLPSLVTGAFLLSHPATSCLFGIVGLRLLFREARETS